MSVQSGQRPVYIKPHSPWKIVQNLDGKAFTRTDMI